MLIDCPACARSYHVNPADIEGGRTVICSRCDARWFVDSLAATPVPPPMPRIASFAQPDSAAPPAAQRRRDRRVPRSAALGLASLALVALTVGARARIVHIVPRSAALYAAVGMPVNLAGLALGDVRIARLDPSSPLVTISGEIRNVVGKRVCVPRLVFEIRDGAGQNLVRWSERAPAKLVGAGGTLAFGSAPHQIPAESRSALVHFESDGDAG